MTSEKAAANFHEIQEKIEQLCTSVGRKATDVSLLAVSKTHAAHRIEDLHSLTGHTMFGENYADELIIKAAELAHLSLAWHYIGRLQSNKIKPLVQAAACIQTVESDKHLRYIERYAKEFGKAPYPVYIAVNAAGEPQKPGLPLADAVALAKHALESYQGIEVCGMMTVPPASMQDDTCDDLPELYRTLAAASRGMGAGRLSLGMTGDLRLAITAGSTMVRIGTAIFGERNYAR